MNMKKIQVINEIMLEQMNHWMLYPLILTVMGVSRALLEIGEPSLPMWALCSLIPFAFFLFRYKVKNLILFVLAHLGVALAVFLLSGENLLTRIVCTICVIGYLIYSFLLRLKQKSVYSDGIHLAVGVGMSAAASLFQYYQGTRGWENYYHIALIVCIALYFLIFYIEHYLEFLSMNKSSAGFLPAAEMFHSGMGMVLVYTLLGIIILLVSTQFEWLANILRPIKDLLLRFLRFLFSRSSGSEEAIPPTVEAIPQGGGMGDMGLPEGGETFWFWEVLEAVTMVLFVAALLAGLAALLWKLFKLIQKYMTFRYQEQEIGTGEAFDLREKCGIEKEAQKKSQGLFSTLSPRERVRKLYKKRLPAAAARTQGQDSLGVRTAREWERTLSLEGMAEVYEKARYSDQEITGADVKKMKDAWK